MWISPVKMLLFLSLLCYGVGVVHSLWLLIRKQNVLFPVAMGAMVVGFLAHTASLVMRGIEVQRYPLMMHQEVSSFLAWAVMAYFLGAQFWYRSKSLSLFVIPVVFIFTATALLLPSDREVPSLLRFGENSPLLVVHASVFVLAYAAFVITFLAGVMYLIQERELKLKRFGSFVFRLPSLDTCDDLSYKSLGIGFVLMTFGIVTGIVGSHHVAGIYWRGDPSEFLALATWIIYLFMIHCRLTAGWRGRRAALVGIVGFAMTLVSLVGVGYLSGFHFE